MLLRIERTKHIFYVNHFIVIFIVKGKLLRVCVCAWVCGCVSFCYAYSTKEQRNKQIYCVTHFIVLAIVLFLLLLISIYTQVFVVYYFYFPFYFSVLVSFFTKDTYNKVSTYIRSGGVFDVVLLVVVVVVAVAVVIVVGWLSQLLFLLSPLALS